MQTLVVAENSNADLKKKLTAKEQAWKSAESALDNAEGQAESQRKLTREANDQLAAAKEQLATGNSEKTTEGSLEAQRPG